MKRTNLVILIVSILAGINSTTYAQAPVTKQENAGVNVKGVANNDAYINQDQKKNSKSFYSEFQKFKKKSEIRIRNNEKVFADFKISFSKLNRTDKDTYQKLADKYEQENTDLKNRLLNYKFDGDPLKWKSFYKAFNHDMDLLGVEMWNVK